VYFKLYTCPHVRELLPFYLASAKLSSLCCPHTVAQKTRLHEDQQFSPPTDKWSKIISNHYNMIFFYGNLSYRNHLKPKHNQALQEQQQKKIKIAAKHQVQGSIHVRVLSKLKHHVAKLPTGVCSLLHTSNSAPKEYKVANRTLIFESRSGKWSADNSTSTEDNQWNYNKE